MTLGQSIRKAREAQGFTREQLAEKARVSAVALYVWEKDRVLPLLSSIILVADALGVSLDELIGRKINTCNGTETEG